MTTRRFPRPWRIGSRMALLAAGIGLTAAALGAFGLHQALRLSRLSGPLAELSVADVIAGEQSLRDLERLRGYGLTLVVAGDASDRQRALAAVAQLSNALSQGPDPRPGALASKAETTLRQLAARMAQAPDSASARREAVAAWTPVGAELSAATERLSREMSQAAAGQADRAQAVIAQSTTRMSAALGALVALLLLGLWLFRRAVSRPLRRLEDALAVRERDYRTLAENSPDPIFRYDRDCRRLYCNPALATAVGVPQAALLGKTIAEFSPFPAEVAQAKAALVRRVMDSGQTGDIELHWERKGVPACLQVRVTPEFDAAGRVVSALSVGRDISALKQAEARLCKSHDILRALAAHQETEREKERQEIASQIHEDLAQNLSALRMNISLVEMNAEAGPRAPMLKGMREIVDRSIARIRDLVSVLRPTVLDLGLVPALHWLTDDFKGVGFQFELALPHELALRDEASIFLFRAAQEIMINIALHAGATHVHLSLASVAGVCHLRVRDNGRGFDPGAPRAQNTFGLISLAAQAQHLGGGLLVDSKPGHGTLIEVRVPADVHA